MKTKVHLQSGNGAFRGDFVLGVFMVPPQVLTHEGVTYLLMQSNEHQTGQIGARERSCIYRECYAYHVPTAEAQAAA